MEKYINASKKPMDQMSRRFKTGVSRSSKALSASETATPPLALFPFSDAP
jgi:hypothetical protein